MHPKQEVTLNPMHLELQGEYELHASMLYVVPSLWIPGAVPSQQPWDEHVHQAAAGITATHMLGGMWWPLEMGGADLSLQDATMTEIVIEYVNQVVTSLKFPPFC